MDRKRIPQTEFLWTAKSEIERIAHACRQVASGFYSSRGFAVLPKPRPQNPAVVVLPPLAYSEIPDYWQRLQKLPLNLPFTLPLHLQDKLSAKAASAVLIDKKLLADKQQQWKKTEQQFWQILPQLIPAYADLIDSLKIYLTAFGTISSYSFLIDKSAQVLNVYLRRDANPGNLAEAIITALLHSRYTDYQQYWEDNEAISDFLLTDTPLSEFFPEYVPTLTNLRRPNKKLRNESEEYLTKLGISKLELKLELKDKKINLNGQVIEAELTTREKQLLSELLENELLTYDRIGDLFWPDEEFYSLWAINRAFSRLRKKLVSLGAPEDWLICVRSRGYTLKTPS